MIKANLIYKYFIMKNLKKLGKILTKTELKEINGGYVECTTHSITDDIYGPYNGGVYAGCTITYSCGDGPIQTGPWHC